MDSDFELVIPALGVVTVHYFLPLRNHVLGSDDDDIDFDSVSFLIFLPTTKILPYSVLTLNCIENSLPGKSIKHKCSKTEIMN